MVRWPTILGGVGVALLVLLVGDLLLPDTALAEGSVFSVAFLVALCFMQSRSNRRPVAK